MQWFKTSMLAAALVVLPVMAIAQSRAGAVIKKWGGRI